MSWLRLGIPSSSPWLRTILQEGMARTRTAVRSPHLALCANELREGLPAFPIASSHSSSPPCLLSLSRPIAFWFSFRQFGVGMGMVVFAGWSVNWVFPPPGVGMRRVGDEAKYIPNMRMYPSIPRRRVVVAPATLYRTRGGHWPPRALWDGISEAGVAERERGGRT